MPTAAVCGTITDVGDGVPWDGLGDGFYSDGRQLLVGDNYFSDSFKWRGRSFLRFNISNLPEGTDIFSATLYIYYFNSKGEDVSDAAPDSADVGHVIVDHIEDWGGNLVVSDYQMASKTANIGTIIPDDTAPGPAWHSLDVTTYVQQDLNEQDPADLSAFRLRQSLEESYANCTASNWWQVVGCAPVAPYQAYFPYLEVIWGSSSSSSCSSSFSSSSSSFSSSSFSSSSSSYSSSSSSFSFSSFSSSSFSESFSISSSSFSSSSFSSSSFSSSSSSFSSSSFSSSSFSSSSFSSSSSSFSSSSFSSSSSSFSSSSFSSSSSSFSSSSSSFSSSSSSFSSSSFSSSSSSFSSSSSSFSSSSFSSSSSSFSSSSSSFSSSSFSSSSSSFSSSSSSFSSSSFSSSSSSFSSSSFSSSSSSFSSSSFSSSSSSFSSSSCSSSFSSSSSSTSFYSSSGSSEFSAEGCGHAYDGTASWDGNGDGVENTVVDFYVGDRYEDGSTKYRYRSFIKFDMSHMPHGASLNYARLYVYYGESFGDGAPDNAPDSADVGHVIVDHIEDWGGDLVAADYQMASKTANIGTIVPDDAFPSGWVYLDVTTQVQADISEQDPTDTSAFRFRQSTEESYANCTESNYWILDGCGSGVNVPYLEIVWGSSSSSSSFSSSSSSSSFSSSSSSFSSSSFSSSSFSSSSFSSSSSSFSSSSSSFSSSSFSSSSSSFSSSSFSSSSSSFSSSSFSSVSGSFSSSSSSFSSSSFSSCSSSFSSCSSSFSSSSSSFSSSSFSSSSFSSCSSSSHSASSWAAELFGHREWSSSSSSFSSSSFSSCSSSFSSSSSCSSSCSSSSYSSNSVQQPAESGNYWIDKYDPNEAATIYFIRDDTEMRIGNNAYCPQPFVAWAHQYKSYLKFDISAIPAGINISSATLWIYYVDSYGDSGQGLAPYPSYGIDLQVDHIEDYGVLDSSDWNPTIKNANIGPIINNGVAPPDWHSLDVTTYVSQDYIEGDAPDTTCYDLRGYSAICSSSGWLANYWVINTPSDTLNPPYLEIVWDTSSSSSSSSSFSSSSSSAASISSSSSSFSSSSSSFSSSSFSSSSSSFSSSSSSFSSSSFSSSSFISSLANIEPCTWAPRRDGGVYDGSGSWDGNGDVVVQDAYLRVGSRFLDAATKNKYRSFVTFDISAIPDDALIGSATLWVYYRFSYGDGVFNDAPDSADVGRLHAYSMESYGLLTADDYQAPTREEFTNVIPYDTAPAGWYSKSVTTALVHDHGRHDASDTSCFSFRQSKALAYAACTASNYWVLDSCSGPNPPYLEITLVDSSSSSSSYSSCSSSSSLVLEHVQEWGGSGSPYYINGPYGIKVYDIPGASEHAFITAYVEAALTVVDVSDPSNPSLAGYISGAGSPNYLDGAIAVDVYTIGGTEYAFVASYFDQAFSIFDVSDPTSPSLVSAVQGPGSPYYLNQAHDVKVHTIGGTEYAFLVSRQDFALIAFDVSTPSSPTLKAVVNGSGSPYYLYAANSVEIREIGGTEYAFITGDWANRLTIYDVSDVANGNLTYVSHIDGSGSPNYIDYPFNLDVVQIYQTWYAVLACRGNTDQASITLINVNDPSNPTYTSSVRQNQNPAWQLYGLLDVEVHEINGVYYVAGVAGSNAEAITIFNISNPNSPWHLAELNGVGSPYYLNGATEVDWYTISGNHYAFVTAQSDDKLTIFDFHPGDSSSWSSSSSSSSSP